MTQISATLIVFLMLYEIDTLIVDAEFLVGGVAKCTSRSARIPPVKHYLLVINVEANFHP